MKPRAPQPRPNAAGDCRKRNGNLRLFAGPILAAAASAGSCRNGADPAIQNLEIAARHYLLAVGKEARLLSMSGGIGRPRSHAAKPATAGEDWEWQGAGGRPVAVAPGLEIPMCAGRLYRMAGRGELIYKHSMYS